MDAGLALKAKSGSCKVLTLDLRPKMTKTTFNVKQAYNKKEGACANVRNVVHVMIL